MRGPVGRILRRVTIWGAGALASAGIAVVALLSFPQPLYAYHVERGGLELWSDQPFDAAAGEAVLADVQARLERSVFGPPDGRHRIFIANAPWRERLFFLWNRGAAGLSYWPVTSNVFLRRSDVAANRLYGASGRPAEPPRTLAYYAAHEIGHGLTGERAGVVAFMRMPRWEREGIADYAALGDGAAREIAKTLAAGDPRLSPERSGQYLRYHLIVACAHEQSGLALDEILSLRLQEPDAAARWLQDDAPGRPGRACRGGKAASLSLAMDEARL